MSTAEWIASLIRAGLFAAAPTRHFATARKRLSQSDSVALCCAAQSPDFFFGLIVINSERKNGKLHVANAQTTSIRPHTDQDSERGKIRFAVRPSENFVSKVGGTKALAGVAKPR